MFHRTNDDALGVAIRLQGLKWALVAASIAVTGIGGFASPADSGGRGATIAPAAPTAFSISIARACPERHRQVPGFPGEAVTESERSNEDIEEAGASAYSWPAGVSARLFSERACRTCATGGMCDARFDVVDLSILCRLLI